MRRLYLLALMSATLIAGVAALAVSSSASAAPKTTTLKLFFKEISEGFKSPSGATLGNNSTPAPGDYFSEAINAYTGTSAHHSSAPAATASLTCVVFDVVNASTDIEGICQGNIAIGTSMLLSVSKQNIAGSLSNVPITGGTGVYKGAKGSVKTKAVGNNSNAVVKFTT